MTLPLIFKRIFNPSWKLLLIWAIIIVPFFSWLLFTHSFDWLLGARYYMKLVFGALIILLSFLFVLDQFLKSSLKRYLFLSIAVWLIICVLFFPIKNLVEKQTESRAAIIINSVEKYKKDFGTYPDSLKGQYFNSLTDRNVLGSYFYYEPRTNKETGEKYFVIYYYTFNGRTGRYSSKDKNWDYYLND